MTDTVPTAATCLALLRAGRAVEAEAQARAALAHSPDAADWLTLLALALSAMQKPKEALPVYRRLTAMQPGIATHWSNLGNCLCELGHAEDAIAALHSAMRLGADDDNLHFGLARAYATIGPPQQGLAHIERALAFAPGDIEFRLLRARLLVATDAWDAANAEIDALHRLRLDAGQKGELGFLLLRGGMYDDALRVFDAVSADNPADLDAATGALLALERLNLLDEASARRDRIRSALAADPHAPPPETLRQADARLALRAGRYDEACELYRALIDGPLHDPALRIGLGFDRAHALDRSGRPGEAIAALDTAHRLLFEQTRGTHPELLSPRLLFGLLDEPVPRIRPEMIDALPQTPQDPVFVVGFPRSGTTLLEQLLDAHGGLHSFDEQPFAQRLMQRLCTGHDTVQAAIDALQPDDGARLRAQYFADVATAVADPHTARLVDKNPLNLVRLPILQQFFPRGKTILALRHPCDVVLSCYMQNFRAPALAVTFASLDSTADMYHRVFDYWWHARESFALPVHVLRYETFVDDTETEARRLFDFLDLPWTPELLAFTERAGQKGKISTPSYSQVVQRVNRRAVGRWQAYRSHFSDMALASLAPWVERLGYPAL